MAMELHELGPSRGEVIGEHPCLLGNTNFPITLKFVDIVYRIKPSKKAGLLSSMMPTPPSSLPDKTILHGVTGMVYPGQMLALLGPSGSGKTTLLNALSGRLSGSLSGTITYNDRPMSKATNRLTGFVTQDDILYPHLTVTETLVFTARLRLPKSVSKKEKKEQAMNVIKILGLVHCKDTIVGSATVRGVSGGERKRVSIGQEILINPSLLFLDEPTSGLDSTTAQKIVSTLDDLAKCGKTIIASIHQPSSRIFYMFDKVMLLSEGNLIYSGEGSEALDYFSRIGHSMKVPMNPADFLLDIANGISYSGSEGDQTSVKLSLISAYNDNLEHIIRKETQEKISHSTASSIQIGKIGSWSSSWWEVLVVLVQRSVKERRHTSFNNMRVFQSACVTMLSSLLWWQSDDNNIQEKAGFLFFISFYWNIIPTIQAVHTFPLERAMLMKERSSGMYRLSSYFMARTLGDMPLDLLFPSLNIIITYWTVGLKPILWNFILTLLAVLYGCVVAQGLGLAIGAAIMDTRSGTILSALISYCASLTSGYFVQHVPVFIAWIQYISPSYYFYRLLLDSQYSGNERYRCGDDTYCYVRDVSVVQGANLGHVWLPLIALLMMVIGYRLVAYAFLLRMKKH